MELKYIKRLSYSHVNERFDFYMLGEKFRLYSDEANRLNIFYPLLGMLVEKEHELTKEQAISEAKAEFRLFLKIKEETLHSFKTL